MEAQSSHTFLSGSDGADRASSARASVLRRPGCPLARTTDLEHRRVRGVLHVQEEGAGDDGCRRGLAWVAIKIVAQFLHLSS